MVFYHKIKKYIIFKLWLIPLGSASSSLITQRLSDVLVGQEVCSPNFGLLPTINQHQFVSLTEFSITNVSRSPICTLLNEHLRLLVFNNSNDQFYHYSPK